MRGREGKRRTDCAGAGGGLCDGRAQRNLEELHLGEELDGPEPLLFGLSLENGGLVRRGAADPCGGDGGGSGGVAARGAAGSRGGGTGPSVAQILTRSNQECRKSERNVRKGD